MQKVSKSDEDSYEIIDWKNSEKYLTASSISQGFDEYKGFSWRVIVKEPITRAFKNSNKNSTMILLASLFAGIIGSLIGIMISNSISKPLQELSKIVDNLRENKEVTFKNNVPNDDIGKLHNAIEIYIRA